MSTTIVEHPEPRAPQQVDIISPEPCCAPAQLDRRQTILLVDDDEALTDVLSFRLERQGFTTLACDSGEAGLRLARQKRPSLVILDLRLPDADGLEICEQLVDDPATCEIPVIVLSGSEQPDILRHCRAAGCCYFVHKPYDPNALLTLINQAIHERQSWDGA